MATYYPPSNNDVPPFREQIGTVVIGAAAGLAAVGFHAVMNLAEVARARLAILATSYGITAQIGVVVTCGILAATAVCLSGFLHPKQRVVESQP